MRKLSMDELNRKTVDEFKEAEKNPFVVVLDDVRSMQNVGSVFRTADAFLTEAIYLCGYTPRPPHRDINKTALGATESVEWHYSEKTIDAVLELKNKGYKVFAIEQVEGSIPLDDFKNEDHSKLALIFGNEVEGVSNDVLQFVDGSIEIPQAGIKHSLNISVAAGIVMWEVFKKYKVK